LEVRGDLFPRIRKNFQGEIFNILPFLYFSHWCNSQDDMTKGTDTRRLAWK
jgi:hypothetical protein